ncbi:ATPase AAA family protein [Babesia bovis T2Bo]|uniref:ATPase, AAA family protein n=1 Tax=Babesia bovis TaxID=5865 RepID=A7AQ06_BABBO|nr:ATPase AAA family protein [Babesia bovis T2Bo]EDO08640.1 ATPase AAA family protein [Babesia bovis T2Bo]|eukprot:XP_001612208.1 ATPase, AAA family protein [Babesia bovis T2Bo]
MSPEDDLHGYTFQVKWKANADQTFISHNNHYVVKLAKNVSGNARCNFTGYIIENVDNGNRVYALCEDTIYSQIHNKRKKDVVLITSEECLMSLGVKNDCIVDTRMHKPGEIPSALSLTLMYLEHYNPKDARWYIGDKPKEQCEETSQITTMLEPVVPQFQNQHPSTQWWEAFIKGDLNQYCSNTLWNYILSMNNVIICNIRGVVTRLSVINYVLEDESHVSPLCSISLDTKVELRIQRSCDKQSDPSPRETKIAGLSTVLNKLMKYVVHPLVFKDEYKKLGIAPPRGVLLYGPPGCGKTSIAKAMKNNMKQLSGFKDDHEVHVMLIQSSDLFNHEYGPTASNIAIIFEQCAKIAKRCPCICFIDEIEILCKKRSGYNTGNGILAAFLNYMDGFKLPSNSEENDHGFVIIGCTNTIDSIDQALRRPGRFDLEVEVGVPNADDRYSILRTLLGETKHNISDKQLRDISDRCSGFVGADLKQLVTSAAWARIDKINQEMRGNSIDDIDILKNRDSNAPFVEKMDIPEDAFIDVDDLKRALTITKPSALRELQIEVPNVKWDDIGGYEDAKRVIKECVEYPIVYADEYKKLQIQAPRGVLLYGPPGCSKTLMAKAVATESHMNFISVKGPEIFNMYVGESERAIRKVFKTARTNAPCVIFFDEMDSISVSREHADSTGVTRRVVSQLLNEMDGISELKQVIVIGATNRPDLMDSALLRPGRLDRLVYIPLPDLEARKKIFSIYLKRLPTDGFGEMNAAETLAHSTNGYSGAEIALICRESAMNALRETINRKQASVNTLSPIVESTDCIKEDRLITPITNETDNLECSENAKCESQSTKSDNNSDIDSMQKDFEGLHLDAVVPVSFSHVMEAMSRVKPRTKPETIRFYENYRNKSPF